MGKIIYVVYNKRSAATGRQLFETLKEAFKGVAEVRRLSNKKKTFAKKPSVIIRWGNSYTQHKDALDIQPIEAVRNASDKGLMMDILSNDPEIPTPEAVVFDGESSAWRDLLDDSGKAFFRNAHDQIRYRSSPIEGDKYALRPINKQREFRVHVFNGKVIGVYEKIPSSPDDKIYKNDNCDFRRIDLANDSMRKTIKGVRPAAKKAVEALGLLYGGVDVVMDENNSPFVLEVNSSPSLNSLNVPRWAENIVSYLEKV